MPSLFAITTTDSSTGTGLLDKSQPASINYKEFRRRDLYMSIQGTSPVDSFVFDSPEVTLICRTDLLNINASVSSRVGEHLAQMYLQRGDDFPLDLRGSFAIIAFDHRSRILKAWTDHFGVDRLVFAESNNAIAVSSDLRLLLTKSQIQPVLDPAAILEYLQYTCIPTPRTIYKGISKLQPGHQLITRPTLQTRPYWDMAYDENSSRSEADWANDTFSAVRSAVELNAKDLLGSDGVGCFLSGGTDSSSVAGFLGGLSARPPRTFSIGFDDRRYNEIDYARIAANRLSADHHEYFVQPDDIVSVVQKAVPVYDEPFGNSSIVPTYYCARLAAENGVSHLLAGDGGDELFGGNSRYADDRRFQRYSAIPRWVRKAAIEPAVAAASALSSQSTLGKASKYIRRSNIPLPDRYFSYSLISSVPRSDLFASDFIAQTQNVDPLIPARRHFQSARAKSDLNRWLYLDLKIIITDNDLRKVSMMSSLAGVTTRYPFLDPSLAEFTGKIPANLKVNGHRLRYLFKKAMNELLPQEIINKTKHGFGLPYSVWLGEHKRLRDFTFDILGSSRCRQRGYFRSDLLEWLWPQYESVHRGYYGEILWIFLMLEMWHVVHVDSASVKEPQPTGAVPQLS